jgi:hypothetical protein
MEGSMYVITKRVLWCVLIATLALGTSALGADREAGPRYRDRPSIVKAIKRFLAHILADISIPPA